MPSGRRPAALMPQGRVAPMPQAEPLAAAPAVAAAAQRRRPDRPMRT